MKQKVPRTLVQMYHTCVGGACRRRDRLTIVQRKVALRSEDPHRPIIIILMYSTSRPQIYVFTVFRKCGKISSPCVGVMQNGETLQGSNCSKVWGYYRARIESIQDCVLFSLDNRTGEVSLLWL